MRHLNLDHLESLPTFEPIHATRQLDRDDESPRRVDRAKPRGKRAWRDCRRQEESAS